MNREIKVFKGKKKILHDSAPIESTETAAATEAPLNIKIATESSYKPFSYTDADGKLIGYEIELVDACLAAHRKFETGKLPGVFGRILHGGLLDGFQAMNWRVKTNLVPPTHRKGAAHIPSGTAFLLSGPSRNTGRICLVAERHRS